MNKQRFIERLNLHLDQELTDEESQELLEVVRTNPEYHRIYVQYCQLFNACNELGERFSESKSVSPWRQRFYAFGGMAAAFALLFLAARNLSPLIVGDDQAGGSPTVLASKGELPGGVLEAAIGEPLLVMDVSELEGRKVRLSDAFEPVTFDLSKAFAVDAESLEFDSDLPPVVFASLKREMPDSSEKPWVKRRFSFGEAVETSTFEHEALSSGDSEDAMFSVSNVGSAFGREEERVRFDLSKAAATNSTASGR